MGHHVYSHNSGEQPCLSVCKTHFPMSLACAHATAFVVVQMPPLHLLSRMAPLALLQLGFASVMTGDVGKVLDK